MTATNQAPDTSLRVYLDQCHFIQLARAASGRSDGAPYLALYTHLETATDEGRVSCPLSLIHYMETRAKANAAARKRLADVMLRLSHLDTIAESRAIVPIEIQRALSKRFRCPLPAPEVEVHGKGIEHATGHVFDIGGDQPSGVPDVAWSEMVASARARFEYLALAGPAADVRMPMFDLHESLDNRFAADEQLLARRLRADGVRGADLDRAVGLIEVGELARPINACLSATGIALEDFWQHGEDWLLEFLGDLPSRRVVWKLRVQRHKNPDEPWKPNDLHDLTALSVAVAYCDVVVPDKQWAHHVRSAQVKVDCVVLGDLRNLDSYL